MLLSGVRWRRRSRPYQVTRESAMSAIGCSRQQRNALLLPPAKGHITRCAVLALRAGHNGVHMADCIIGTPHRGGRKPLTVHDAAASGGGSRHCRSRVKSAAIGTTPPADERRGRRQAHFRPPDGCAADGVIFRRPQARRFHSNHASSGAPGCTSDPAGRAGSPACGRGCEHSPDVRRQTGWMTR